MSAAVENRPALLGAGDPDPVLAHGDGRRSSFLLVCDHAGNAVPRRLGGLGLAASRLADHIAWDPNAWQMTQALADALGAPALGQAYSRLVIDCNRRLDAADSVAPASDGTAVPGNAACTDEDRRERHAAIMEPYQARIASTLAGMQAADMCCIVSMHSFTPRLAAGDPRPWHIGVISGPDERMRRRVFARLAASAPSLTIGENVPYTVSLEKDYTLPVHAEGRGVPYVEFEFRNDMFGDVRSRTAAAGLVAEALRGAFEDVRAAP